MEEPSPVGLFRYELTVLSGLATMETSRANTILKSYPRVLNHLKSESPSLSFNALKRLKISFSETLEGENPLSILESF